MNTAKDSPNNIDQIRQLIFGDQIQDYERRFQELLKKVDRIDQKVDGNKEAADEKVKTLEEVLGKKLAENHKSIQQELDTKTRSIQQEIQEILQKVIDLTEDKIDRGQLADQLIDLAMRLKGSTILDHMEKEISGITE